MNLVHTAHQRQFLGILADWLVVKTRPIYAEQLALPTHRQRNAGLDERAPRFHRNRPSPLDKKSRSTVNSPIFCNNSASRSGVFPALPASASKALARLSKSWRFHL